MKRIGFLTHASELSGAEFSLLRLVSAMQEDPRGYQPVVIVASEGPLGQACRERGIEVCVLELDDRARDMRKERVGSIAETLRGAASTAGYALRLARLVRAQRLDLLHSNSLKAHLYCIPVAAATRRPLVWHLRDTIDESYLPRAAVQLVRAAARIGPSYVVGVSQHVIDCLRLPATARTRVVHDGLDVGELQTLAPLPGAAPRQGRPVIALVGRLDWWKGQHVAVAAMAELARQGVDAELQIAGSALFGKDAYERELRESVVAQGLTDHVTMLGQVSDVPGLLHRSDVLLHASVTPDPLPGVVLEGMAAGLPVVATRGGGVPEMLRHDVDGFMVPMGDSAAMADALHRLLDQPELRARFGAAGRERVGAEFTLAGTVDGVLGVYDEVLAG